MERDTKNTTTKLKADVFSHVAKDPHKPKSMLKYGSEGEEVRVISDKGNTIIVENKKGNRYPVNRKDLV